MDTEDVPPLGPGPIPVPVPVPVPGRRPPATTLPSIHWTIIVDSGGRRLLMFGSQLAMSARLCLHEGPNGKSAVFPKKRLCL